MKLTLLYAVPSYRARTHDCLQDQAMELLRACITSELREMQWKAKRGAAGALPIVGAPVCWSLLPRAYAHGYDIASARNYFVRAALNVRADWLLMSDSDNWCPDGAGLLRMLQDAHVRGASVVAAPVLRRDGTYNAHEKASQPPMEKDRWRDRMIEVERVGAACMGVSVRWMAEHWPSFDEDPWFVFRTHCGNPNSLSEDFGFCDKVRARGGKVLLDGRIEPIHEGAPYPKA